MYLFQNVQYLIKRESYPLNQYNQFFLSIQLNREKKEGEKKNLEKL